MRSNTGSDGSWRTGGPPATTRQPLFALLALVGVVAGLLAGSSVSAGADVSGDADCSGAVDAKDSLHIVRTVALGGAGGCLTAGDVDCNGITDLVDSLLILRWVALIPAELPGDCPGIGDPVTLEGLPVSFSVDNGLSPSQPEIEGIDGGPPRPLATVQDERGHKADFVENELVLWSNDPGELDALLDRWDGELLAQADGDGGGVHTVYLVRINTALADVIEVPAVIKELDAANRGAHRVSTMSGLGLLTAGATEAANGLNIGVNWVMYGNTLRERTTTEGPDGPDIYVTDAYEWSYLKLGGVQDIGVTEAWTALAKTDRLDNESTIAILDGGFSPDDDFPEIDASFGAPFNRANPVNCSGGPCPFHGTNVLHAAMGIPDNGYGVAGPGGPVARAITFGGAFDVFNAIGAISDVRGAGADIINMSWGGDTPASLSWALAPFNLATEAAANNGVLLFAAAGNDGVNVDAEDCFIVCWEEAWNNPCENNGVICVGALDWNSQYAALYSNYGGEDVDIFAPGTVFVGPDPTNTDVSFTSGTSVASPFAAGVAALIWAADPNRSAGEVIGLMMEHAHASPHSKVESYVNAWGAVKDALGGNTPPNLDITTPADGSTYSRGSQLVSFSATASDAEDGTPSINWISNLDGPIGSGILVQRNDLSYGTHNITAIATDSGGFTDFEAITVTIENDPPVVQITNPPDGAEFFQGQTIHLTATSLDTNAIPQAPLPDSALVWHLEDTPNFATGHSATIPGGTLPLGPRVIAIVATEGELVGDDFIVIMINEDPADIPPTPQITSPANGATFTANASDAGGDYRTVTFVGTATDPEDGTLSGDSLQWHYRLGDSGIFQPVGTGTSRNIKLYVVDCFGTDYQVRLTAIDSANNISTTMITVTVNSLC